MAKTYKGEGNAVYASFDGGERWVPVGSFDVVDVDFSGCKTDSEKMDRIESTVGKKASIACDFRVPDAMDFMYEQVYLRWLRKKFMALYWN